MSSSPSTNNGLGKRTKSFGSSGSLNGSNKNSPKDKNRPELLRGGSRDNVRRIVEKEGKTARNLVIYSVPTEQEPKKSAANRRGRNRLKENKPQRGRVVSKKQPAKQSKTNNSNTSKNQYPQSNLSDNNEKKKEHKENEEPNDTIAKQNGRETKTEKYQEQIRQIIEKSSESAKHERSNSVTSVQSQKNLRARYWSYLFDNFHRAVDEIYNTCDHDESIIECKEVIMVLDVCKRDFSLLIQRLELFNKLETSDVKPQSLAWEVRKQMSPGKCPSPTMNSRRSPSPAAVRYLNFGPTKSTLPFSWADRVRGFSSDNPVKEMKETVVDTTTVNSKSSFPSPVLERSIEDTLNQVSEDETDDGEGWEIVTKGRSRSKASSLSISSTSSSQSHIKHLTQQKIAATLPQILQNQKLNADLRISSLLKSNENIISSDVDLSYAKVDGTKSFDGTTVDDITVEEYVDIEKGVDGGVYPELDYSYVLSDDENDELNLQIKEEQEKALASAIAEEETLTKELEEEALKDDEHDDELSSDRDYATTDDGRETPKDLTEEFPLDTSSVCVPPQVSLEETDKPMSWDEMCMQYDNESGTGINWADMMDVENVRMPGRALEMHQKLSSPSRKKSRSESLRRSEEKMARAERRRLKFLVDKCERLKALSEKVRKVREIKHQLINEKEKTMQDQLTRADSRRKVVLQEKIRKAQEEEAKVNEIAFINTLEAQNKKIEVQEKHQVSEARLQEIIEERQRRKVDKHAKEEAAQGRRRALEEERLARLQEIKLKRVDQAVKWQKERGDRVKTREEQAKERQREREQKVAARNEALQQAAEELQKRIEQKHIESTRRHEQRIEEVKEKSRAASSSRHATVEETPSCVPYEKIKKCTLCDIEIASDVYMVSHLKGKKHKTSVRELNKKITDAEMEAFSSKYIKDAEPTNQLKKQQEEDEKAKVMKKRAKKIKSRMAAKGKDFEANALSNIKAGESQKRGRFQRAIKEINKALQAHCNGPWPANKVATLDKSINEICRSLEGKNTTDQIVFCQLGGLAVLARVLLLWDTSTNDNITKSLRIPTKIIKHTLDAIYLACNEQYDNCQYMLLGNKLTILVDLLVYRLKIIDNVSISKEKGDNGATINPSTTTTLIEVEVEEVDSKEDSLKNIIKLQDDESLTISILKTITCIFHAFLPKLKVKKSTDSYQDVQQRLMDVVSYLTCCDVFGKLVSTYKSICGPIEESSSAEVVTSIVTFLQAVSAAVVRLDCLFNVKKEDLSMICQTMKSTEAFGLVALIYSLLHPGSTTRISPSPLPLAETSIAILITVFKTLNVLALVDIHSFQSTLASEGISLQYQSVLSYLLRYTSNEKCDDLLHEVILSIGYFTMLNNENQMFLQSGRGPTLIQQLCTLPFGYFSDPKLKSILFPTLICTSFNNIDNKRIIAQEVSPTLLAIYIEENMKKEKCDIQLSVKEIYERSHLQLRYPSSHWEEAKIYFNDS